MMEVVGTDGRVYESPEDAFADWAAGVEFWLLPNGPRITRGEHQEFRGDLGDLVIHTRTGAAKLS